MKYPAVIAVLAIGMVPPTVAVAQVPREVASHQVYVPSLGDIMGATQLRHIKLWFAGKLRNWELATYELGQIKASFEDAATLYPGIPITDMTIVAAPVQSLGDAIAAKDSARFKKAFDELTVACNGCHQAIGRSFITIQVPTASPFSNQPFSLHAKP